MMTFEMDRRLPRRWVPVVVMAMLGGAAYGEVLLDQMNIITGYRYDLLYGNAIGGDYLGNGGCFAVQVCDDFATTATGYIVTEVEVGNLFLEGHHDVDDVRVSIYPDLDGQPGEDPVYSARVSEMTVRTPVAPLGIVNTDFFDDVWRQFYGVRTRVTGLWIPLEPNTRYFICVQVISGPDDWAYTCMDWDAVFGADSFVRDGPPDEGCNGGWGWNEWREAGSFQDPVSSPYRVVAVGDAPPEPRDFDRDGAVTAEDLVGFVRAWVAGEGDTDGDGDTDAADFVSFVSAWAEGGRSAPSPIKE